MNKLLQTNTPCVVGNCDSTLCLSAISQIQATNNSIHPLLTEGKRHLIIIINHCGEIMLLYWQAGSAPIIYYPYKPIISVACTGFKPMFITEKLYVLVTNCLVTAQRASVDEHAKYQMERKRKLIMCITPQITSIRFFSLIGSVKASTI